MDTRQFNVRTRRRFGLGLSGLAAGLLGTVTGGGVLARKGKGKKKKCKKLDLCPQRWCCRCDQGAIACTHVDGIDLIDAEANCNRFCETFPDDVTPSVPGVSSATCDVDGQCAQVRCPVGGSGSGLGVDRR